MGLFGGLLGNVFNFAGSFLGGQSAKGASRNAQTQQLDFLNRALGVEQQQQQQDRTDLAPFLASGQSALRPRDDLLGLHGNEAQQTGIEQVMNSPWYQALYRNGLEANLQNASATGGIRGGNETRSLADFSSDTLATSIDRMLQQLTGAAGMGLNATGTGIQAGQNTTNQISNNYGAQGQVTAGGILTRGGINSGLWNNAGALAQDLSKYLPF